MEKEGKGEISLFFPFFLIYTVCSQNTGITAKFFIKVFQESADNRN